MRDPINDWKDAKYLRALKIDWDWAQTQPTTAKITSMIAQIEAEVTTEFGMTVQQFQNVPLQGIMPQSEIDAAWQADLAAGNRSERR